MKEYLVGVNKKWKRTKQTDSIPTENIKTCFPVKKICAVDESQLVQIETNNIITLKRGNINIEEIVDTCFQQEQINWMKTTTNTETRTTSQQISKYEKRKKKAISNTYHTVEITENRLSPICFTIEEEFCIQDLVAKRECMNEVFHRIKSHIDPIVLEDSKRIITQDIEQKRKIFYEQKLWDLSMKGSR